MEFKPVGTRIKQKRLEKSWSQEDFAEKVNLSAVYIGMIERGEKTPKLETFIRIVNTLNVTADELLVDVISQGYKIRLSEYADRISKLNAADQKRIYGIIDAFLQNR